ncbi:MAG: hypothetical protein Q8L47_03765 [bacterium]|nr:hypothetical protein [bacterium]
MTEGDLSTLDKFKISCILEDKFIDKEIKTLVLDVIIANEIDIQELLGILKKYRPIIYDSLLGHVTRKANASELVDEDLYQQKISRAFRNLNSHDPIIRKDILGRIVEEFAKGDK